MPRHEQNHRILHENTVVYIVEGETGERNSPLILKKGVIDSLTLEDGTPRDLPRVRLLAGTDETLPTDDVRNLPHEAIFTPLDIYGVVLPGLSGLSHADTDPWPVMRFSVDSCVMSDPMIRRHVTEELGARTLYATVEDYFQKFS